MVEHRKEQNLEELVKTALTEADGDPDVAVDIIYNLFKRDPLLVDWLELDPVLDFAALAFRHFTAIPFFDTRQDILWRLELKYADRKERAETFAQVRADELRRIFAHWYSEEGTDWRKNADWGFPQNKDSLVPVSIYAEVLWATPRQTRDTIAKEIRSRAAWLSDNRLNKILDDASLPEVQSLLSSSMIGARLGLRKLDVKALRIRSIQAMDERSRY